MISGRVQFKWALCLIELFWQNPYTITTFLCFYYIYISNIERGICRYLNWSHLFALLRFAEKSEDWGRVNWGRVNEGTLFVHMKTMFVSELLFWGGVVEAY